MSVSFLGQKAMGETKITKCVLLCKILREGKLDLYINFKVHLEVKKSFKLYQRKLRYLHIINIMKDSLGKLDHFKPFQ